MTTIEAFAPQTMENREALFPSGSIEEPEKLDTDGFPPHVIPSENRYVPERRISDIDHQELVLMQIDAERQDLHAQLHLRVRNHMLDMMAVHEDANFEFDPYFVGITVLLPEYELEQKRHEKEALRIKGTEMQHAAEQGNLYANGIHDYVNNDVPILAARAEAHYYMAHVMKADITMVDEAKQAEWLIGKTQEVMDGAEGIKGAREQAQELFAVVMVEKVAFLKEKLKEKQSQIRFLEGYNKSDEAMLEELRANELELRAEIERLKAEKDALTAENQRLEGEIEVRDLASWETEDAVEPARPDKIAA